MKEPSRAWARARTFGAYVINVIGAVVLLVALWLVVYGFWSSFPKVPCYEPSVFSPSVKLPAPEEPPFGCREISGEPRTIVGLYLAPKGWILIFVTGVIVAMAMWALNNLREAILPE